jgi:very-short-patch-repair endonuclease
MDRFVLDFYCPEKRLAVEIDGEIHNALNGADEERQAILESMGIRFIRLSAEFVETDLSAAVHTIEQAVFNPSPLPRERGRPKGGGEG